MLEHLRKSNVVSLWLVIAFIGLRSIVPLGFMLHVTEGSALTFAICHEKIRPADTRQTHQHDSSHHISSVADNDSGDNELQILCAENRCANCLAHSPMLANGFTAEIIYFLVDEQNLPTATATFVTASRQPYQAREPPTLS